MNIQRISFYLTPPHPCSYIAGNTASTAFADPNIKLTPAHYNHLIRYGFRRSGKHIYRPHCDNCSACISIRVKTNEFKAGRRFKRVLSNNSDLICEITDNANREEHYQLYRKYISSRHQGGEMDEDNPDTYKEFICSNWSSTIYLEARLQQKLLGVAVIDQVENGISAVYSFFDPDYPKRSLGNYLILKQIELNNKINQEYLYLGYWIEKSQKMNYKADYKPHQLFIEGKWTEE
ncbi:MAG: arginyltransferase [Gammaproteobacteria bacterium]|nr:MAG: arginyltransferase [Gammaproteobacteria bacterium]